jgi:UDP-N-acetylglucosamine transferase subunit ALG13
LIFITTGSSLPHDDLILQMDTLKAMGYIPEHRIYAQIGNGKYIPKNMVWLRFIKNMEEVYKRADIIISNCGAGTIMENVIKGRKIIAVQNPDITGGHEWELVSKMESLGCLIWCKEVKDLLDCIKQVEEMDFKKFVPDKLNMDKILKILELE